MRAGGGTGIFSGGAFIPRRRGLSRRFARCAWGPRTLRGPRASPAVCTATSSRSRRAGGCGGVRTVHGGRARACADRGPWGGEALGPRSVRRGRGARASALLCVRSRLLFALLAGRRLVPQFSPIFYYAKKKKFRPIKMSVNA
jgi:hypothetical protein